MDEGMKCFTVELPLYKTSVSFVVGCGYGRMLAHVKDSLGVKLDGDGARAAGRTFFARYGPIVWVAKKKGLAALAHEIFHAAVEICESRGVPTNDEACAYLIELLTAEAYRNMGVPCDSWSD